MMQQLRSVVPKGFENLCPPKNLHMMFREALFIIAKMLKPSRSPSVGEWINKLWYIQTIDYLVLKK